MFPMITTSEEFDAARKLVDGELQHIAGRGHAPPDRVQVGAMLEVPSLLFQLDEILQRVDFLSVGSNDLLQYFFAADRTNPRVADRFDPLSVPVLRALRRVVERAEAAGKPLTICGEMASHPLEAIALVAIGFRSISLSAGATGPVKAMLLGLDVGAAAAILAPLLAGSVDRSPRTELLAFAKSQGLQV
jgi:phosphotransferase system enzyme I (PtsP)